MNQRRKAIGQANKIEDAGKQWKTPSRNQFGCRYINLADRTLVQREAPRDLLAKYAEDDDKLNEARQRHADGLLLRGRSLRYAVLNRSNLFRADLIGADLRHARLDQTDLTRAVLRDASMGNIALRGANLNGAVLTNARLDKAALECIFIKIPNPQLGNADSGSSCTQLKGADLSGARLQGANLFRASLQGADLFIASLQGANLSKLDFTPLGTKEGGAIRRMLKTANKNKRWRKRVATRLKSGMVPGAAGHPTNLKQSAKKTEIFMKDHRIFAGWDRPVHHHEEAGYIALLVPQLAELACAEPQSARGLSHRAAPNDFLRSIFGAKAVPGLATALLDAPCFKDLKLPEEVVADLKQERTKQAKAARKSSGAPASTTP